MKPVYLGTVRGHQAPVYRPGLGWSGADDGRRNGRRSPIFAGKAPSMMYGYTLAESRRSGARTRVAVIAGVVIVVALLALVFGGAGRLF
ncbi:MAG: hypothetical protein JW990_03500 [Thermoleophilia bacterium]|nr:hypothetical protein [Thermoleophilia bacterium]